MRAFIFTAAMAAVSLFGFIPSAALAQDDVSTMERLDDGLRTEHVTFVGLSTPQKMGDAIIKYRRANGEVWGCPEKNPDSVNYWAATAPGNARLLMTKGYLKEECKLVEEKR